MRKHFGFIRDVIGIMIICGISAFAQTPVQIPLTGNIGVKGSVALLGGVTVQIPDANTTLTPDQFANKTLIVTSSATLSATRNIVAPLNKGQEYNIENLTTGGQSIQIIGASGTGVTVDNGKTAFVFCDGTNYILAGSAGSPVLTGTTIPRSIAVPNIATNYTQTFADGSTDVWKPSATGLNWISSNTGQIVYAGNATMIVNNALNCYDMVPGATGNVPDTCGSAPLTLNGTLTRNATTGGILFPGSGGANWLGGFPPANFVNGNVFQFAVTNTGTVTFSVLMGETAFTALGFDQTQRPIEWNASSTIVTTASSSTTWIAPRTSIITFLPKTGNANTLFSGSSQVPAMTNAVTQTFPGTNVVGIGNYTNFGNYPFGGTMYGIYVYGPGITTEEIQHNADVLTVRLATRTVTATGGWNGSNTNTNMLLSGIGDSITEGATEPFSTTPRGYLNWATSFLNTQINVMDFGVGGQLTTGLAAWEIPAACKAASTWPNSNRVTTLGIGTNDLPVNLTNYAASLATYYAQLHACGYRVIAVTIPPKNICVTTCETNRLAANAALIASQSYDGLVDIGSDLKYQNPVFTPYSSEGIHPNDAMYQVIGHRLASELNRMGVTAKSYYAPCVTYATIMNFDLSTGLKQCVILTGPIGKWTVSGYNGGEDFTIDFIQDAVGGRTFGLPVLGTGATAHATLSGTASVFNLDTGGNFYVPNYLPTIVASGGTCTTFPRFTAVLTGNSVTSATGPGPVGNCTVAPTLTFVSNEPVFHGSFILQSAANKITSLHFHVDATGANIYSENQTNQ